jgi:CheY-like chemotaxis protein
VLDDAPWRIRADPGQLENALLNLAINARDAMPEGGTLRIETANVGQGRNQGLGEGDFVMLAVSDTGTGIAPEIVDRVFEPFFTTKEVGKGSGLGLSMAYGFVKQSGETMEIESEPGRGTTLRLYLPRRRDEPGADLADRPMEPNRGARGRTILVVEDEPAVRELAVRILRSLGYETVEAASGESGLAELDNTPDVALLFSDVVLAGGMNGLELAREARRRRPGLKVLFTSGYTDFAGIDAGQLTAEADLIPKPFRKADLAERLHAILGD